MKTQPIKTIIFFVIVFLFNNFASSSEQKINNLYIVIPSYGQITFPLGTSEKIKQRGEFDNEERSLHYLGNLNDPNNYVIFVMTNIPLKDIIDYYFEHIPGSVYPNNLKFFTAKGNSRDLMKRTSLDKDLIKELQQYISRSKHVHIKFHQNTPDVQVLYKELNLPVRSTLLWTDHKDKSNHLFKKLNIPYPKSTETMYHPVDDITQILNCSANEVYFLKGNSGIGNRSNATWYCGQPLPSNVTDDPYGFIVQDFIDGKYAHSTVVRFDVGSRTVKFLGTWDQQFEDNKIISGTGPSSIKYEQKMIDYGERIAHFLMKNGHIGEFGLGYMVNSHDGDSWNVYAIDLNVRDGGGTFPLRWKNILFGSDSRKSFKSSYTVERPKNYSAKQLIEKLKASPYRFDHQKKKGAILGLLSSKNYYSLVTYADSAEEAENMFESVKAYLNE